MYKFDQLYTFQNFYIPERMQDSITHYIEDGYAPGSFLTAIICNNLRMAVEQADAENLNNLPAYVDFFYNHAPMGCWGSKERMEKWIKEKAEKKED